jgi:predicted secreted protein
VSTLADYPELVAQLDRTKNGTLAPESIARASGRRLWWRCPEGPDHLWEAPVSRRTAGHGCPFCANLRLSATNTLAAVAPEIARQWHPEKNGKLTPHDVVSGTPRVVWWRCAEDPDHVWERAIVARVHGDGCPFCVGRRRPHQVAHDVVASAPHLVAEWHPTKNRKLTPRDVTLGSGRVVWWKCPKGPDHAWRCAVGDRLKQGCPFCANMRVSSTNSLAAVAPEIAAEWHPTKNRKLTPHDVIAGSPRRVWWKCPKGPDHEWPTSIANRVGGTGCPCCANRRICSTNSLAAVYPKVAAEWHPTKNGKLTPRAVVPGTPRRVWWRCAFGHVWCTSVSNRTQRGSNCPECWRLRRRQPVVTTGKRRGPVRLASYEGASHGPVRRVK